MRFFQDIKLSIAVITFVILLLFAQNINPHSSFYEHTLREVHFWDELNECTTGVCSGAATLDGKPLLWKNRDVGNPDQEFQYYDDGRIPFISIAYANNPLSKFYGGVNLAGFAVENSNSYNLSGSNGDDDGYIHREALATCRTVDDFEALLDSIHNDGGIRLDSNYGSLDAFGGAAMFEVSGEEHVRWDCDDQPGGIIVRSNYSYSGRNIDNRPGYWGPHRHDRALTKWKAAVESDNLTPKYLFQKVIRDISVPNLDPYPLPFDGYYGNNPYGHIPNGRAICRSSTAGIVVVQGVQEDQNPDESILWAMCGNQIGTIAVPLWVRAGSVPEQVDGVTGSVICNSGIEISEWVNRRGSVDTWKLTNSDGTGIWDYTIPIENWVFEKVDRFINSPEFDLDLVETFQNEIAEHVSEKLNEWTPVFQVTDMSTPVHVDGNIELVWSEVNSDGLGRDSQPDGYAIYRSLNPFRASNRGEQIGYTSESRFIDDNPPPGSAYYRIDAVF